MRRGIFLSVSVLSNRPYNTLKSWYALYEPASGLLKSHAILFTRRRIHDEISFSQVQSIRFSQSRRLIPRSRHLSRVPRRTLISHRNCPSFDVTTLTR